MAKHDTLTDPKIQAAIMRQNMKDRYAYLYINDLYNGQDAGEFEELESILADMIIDGSDDHSVLLGGQSSDNFASSDADGIEGGCEERCGGSRTATVLPPSSPRLLTGGYSCTDSPGFPESTSIDVHEFAHAGYDTVYVGFDADINDIKHERTLAFLADAKERAIEASREGLEGFATTFCGKEILVLPKGGKAGGDDAKGGVVYPYRFYCEGVEYLLASKISKHIQPVRVRYGAESIQGHRNKFFDIHFGSVLPYLKKLGFIVIEDKVSRIDMQCLLDVSMETFRQFFQDGQVVMKLRKLSVHGSMTRTDTITAGSIDRMQIQFYNKRRELQSQKSNIVKESLFVRDCVGDEWFNSGRPITRTEIRLSRDVLKCFGVSSVADLQKSERGMIELVTTEWFRILDKPKVRGHENNAAIHPIWERVRNLFFAYFTGNEVEVEWKKREPISCDPEALEKQALGCLSKALAFRHGEQSERKSSVCLANDWVDSVGVDLHAKLNTCAVLSRHKTGVEFGVSSGLAAGYDIELEPSYALEQSVIDRKRAEVGSWCQSASGGLR